MPPADAQRRRPPRRAPRRALGQAHERPAPPSRPAPRPAPRVTPSQRRAARQSLTPFARPTPPAPTAPAAHRAARRVQQATPARPMPHVPIIRNPTPRQARAAQRIIAGAINRQVRGRTPVERARHRAAIVHEIATDPRQAHVMRASRHYARALRNQQAEVRGRQALRQAANEPSGLLAARFVPVAGEKPFRVPRERRAVAEGRRFARLSPRQQRITAGRGVPVTNPRARAGTRAPDRRVNVGLATINTSALGRSLGDRVASGHGLAAISFANRAVPQILKNAGKDALNFPVDAVKALYEMAAASWEVSGKGNTDRAMRIAQGMTEGAIGHLARGDVNGAWRAFKEHPLYTATEFTGAAGALGRTAGAAGRLGLAGKLGREAASTAREPLRAAGGVQRERSYSKNLIVAAGQKAGDRRLEARGLDPNEARNLRFQGPRNAVSALTGGATQPGEKGLIREVSDQFSSQEEGLRRQHRDLVRKEIRQVARTVPRDHRSLIHMAVERRINRGSLRQDLHRERDRLERVYHDEYQDMRPTERHANRRQVYAIDKALHDDKLLADPSRLFDAADHVAARTQDITDRLVSLGVLDREQATAAAERPYAISQGARYSHEKSAFPQAEERHAVAHDDAQIVARDASKAKRAHERALRDFGRVQEAERQKVQGLSASDPKALQEALGQLDERHTAATQRFEHARAAMANARTPEARAHFAEEAQSIQQELSRTEALASGLKAELDSQPHVRVQRQVAESERRIAAAHEKVVAAREARREAETAARRAKRTAQKQKPKQYREGMTRGGERLSTSQQVREREAAGVEAPGFLTHRPDLTGGRAYFSNWFDRRKTSGRHLRTGESTRQGSHDISPDALEASVAHALGVADAVSGWDRFVGRMGMRHEEGRMFTGAEAERLAENSAVARNGQVPGERLVPVRAVPASYDAARAERIMGLQQARNAPEDFRSMLEGRVNDAIASVKPEELNKARFVLVPEEAISRFQKHQLGGSSDLARGFSKATGQFRKTVLPFSPKWLFGNMAEGVLRLGVAGTIPLLDSHVERLLYDRMLAIGGKEAADAGALRLKGGMIFGTTERTTVYRDAASMAGTTGGDAAHALRAMWDSPAARATIRVPIAGIGVMQKLLFGLNKFAEQEILQSHGIGKLVRRDIQELTGSWTKGLTAQREALDEVARGVLGGPKAERFARELDEMLGKYQRFSPTMRRVTQNMAPFLPWYLNAARFVYHTLPARHPVKTAVLASVERTFQKDWAEQYRDTPPGDLMQAIRLKDGGYLPVGRFTPFGAFGEVSTKGIAQLLDPILPQLSSAIRISAAGQNFAGRPLQLASGDAPDAGMKSALAIYSLLESFVPLVQIGRRLQERGETPFDDSTIWAPKTKQGTAYHGGASARAAANRVFNPLRPTYLQAPPNTTVTSSAPQRLSPEQKLLRHEVDLAKRDQQRQRSAGQDPLLRKEIELAKRGG